MKSLAIDEARNSSESVEGYFESNYTLYEIIGRIRKFSGGTGWDPLFQFSENPPPIPSYLAGKNVYE